MSVGKQLNFYLDVADWQMVSDYLSIKEFLILSDSSPIEKPLVLPELKTGVLDSTQYLVLASQIDEVQTTLHQIGNSEEFAIDIYQSPVIELDTGFANENNVSRGRLYYIPTFIDKEGELIDKNEEFLRATRNLFTWFKRSFIPLEKNPSFYTSELAKKKKLVLQ